MRGWLEIAGGVALTIAAEPIHEARSRPRRADRHRLMAGMGFWAVNTSAPFQSDSAMLIVLAAGDVALILWWTMIFLIAAPPVTQMASDRPHVHRGPRTSELAGRLDSDAVRIRPSRGVRRGQVHRAVGIRTLVCCSNRGRHCCRDRNRRCEELPFRRKNVSGRVSGHGRAFFVCRRSHARSAH